MEQVELDSAEQKVGSYLNVMVTNDGSDLFLHTGAKPTIKGSFGFKVLDEKLQFGETEKMLRSMLTDQKMAEYEQVGEIDFSFSISGLARFRGNAFRQRHDTAIVMRHVKSEVPTVDKLGLPAVLRDLVENKHGLIVVAGATGSGKSTSLAAMIDHRNTNFPGHIITLEDPIEFLHSHKKSLVAQREIGMDTDSFETGMRAAMREAPDVILMGEIRDQISMEYALRFANTGHLCLSTIHSNTAITSIERMLSFFDKELIEQEAKRLSQNLRAVVCQRLIPSTNGGKVAAFEILVNTPRMADLMARMDYDEMRAAVEAGEGYGMITFDKSIINLFEEGLLDEKHATDYAESKAKVTQFIRFQSKRADKPAAYGADLKLQDIEDD
jgi:twitching motility protein PilU